MILYQDGIFHLNTPCWSCLLRISPQGLPELIHYGAPVTANDVQALSCKPGLGWGTSLLLDEKDITSSPEYLPLAWSGSGHGDFRESPCELECNGVPLVTHFRYSSHRIHTGTVPMQGLPQAQDGAETLEIVLEQPEDELVLHLYWTVFPDALTRRTVLENKGSRTVCIRKLMSSSADLPGRFEMTTLNGGWIAETHKHTAPVGPTRLVNESITGFSSNRHNPGFLLADPQATETCGQVYGFNLVYSGSHYAGVQRSLQGLTRVLQGISPSNFAKELAPDTSFETPEAVLAWSDEGYDGLSRRMHGFINRHIVPKAWQFKERPVLYNSWEGCMFDFNQHRLLKLAKQAKGLGCELFVLDDGWFGARNDDTAGLGDYRVNTKKLPQGLAGLAKKIKAMGMDFGLWFEPESVNPDSDLYRAHPDWALTDRLPPVLGRHQFLLDLTRSEVRDYIVENVGHILDSAEISYVKWDMNRHSTALGIKAHDYILGLYDVLRRIFGPRPHILLESCASGGNRFDLGMMTFSPQIWCSDNTDPVERLDIQEGLSYLYPQSVMGAHVSASPHAQTLRTTPLYTRANVSFFGILGYELDLEHLLPVEKKDIAAQIAYYKDHRSAFQFGTFHRLDVENGTAWQVSKNGMHLVGLFHRLIHAAPGYERLYARHLNPDSTYQVISRPQTLRVGPFGSLLSHVSPVSINPNGMVLRTADRHYTMTDGAQKINSSGAALMSGWMLPPHFTGTGYDQNGRMQSDFGSNLFEIREVISNEEL